MEEVEAIKEAREDFKKWALVVELYLFVFYQISKSRKDFSSFLGTFSHIQ